MKKVILLNAPPYSGKDLVASLAIEQVGHNNIPMFHKEFKEVLFKATKAAFQIPEDVWDSLYTITHKDKPTKHVVLNGEEASLRQAMINTSENVFKPIFGDDVFGLAALNSLEEGWNIFSDSGFYSEAKVLVDKLGSENVQCVKIVRKGCTFEGDSRDWLDCDLLGIKEFVLYNNDIEDLPYSVNKMLYDLGVYK